MRLTCHVSQRVKGCCDICEEWPELLHMPEDLHGWYCPECCPACKVQPITVQAVEDISEEVAPQAA